MKSVKPFKSQQIIDKIKRKLRKKPEKYLIMLLLGIETGLRISDILRLQPKHFQSKISAIIEKKTKKIREFELSRNLRNRIKRYIVKHNLQLNDFLIFSRPNKKSRPLSRIQAYRILRSIGDELKLKGTGTHSLRKTFATEHFKREKNLLQLQNILNHKYLHTTLMYLFTLEELNSIVKD